MDNVIVEIERAWKNADDAKLKKFFECQYNFADHLYLVVRPYLLTVAYNVLLANLDNLNSSECQCVEGHIRQHVDHYVDKMIKAGIMKYRRYST